MALARPTQQSVPFASSGVKNAIPETATGSNLASLQEGFPTVTMTDVDQGGMPPQGQDMNGILFDVTTAIRYQQAGGLFPYDATFAAAIDGYPLGAILTATDGSCLYQNTVSGNQTDPENGGTGWSQILSSASIAGKQDKLSPTQMDAVNSGITAARVAIYDGYAAGKQDTLTFDNAPTSGSTNPVTSDGIYAALGTKQDTITVDAVPTSGSINPVQSGGVYDAVNGKVSKSGDTMTGELSVVANYGVNDASASHIATTDFTMKRRSCYVGQNGNGVASPWFKVGAYTTTTNSAISAVCLFDVASTLVAKQGGGQLRVFFRLNANRVLDSTNTKLEWVTNYGNLNPDDFVLLFNSDSSSITLDLYVKCATTDLKYVFKAISEKTSISGSSNAQSLFFSLANNVSTGSLASLPSGTQIKSKFKSADTAEVTAAGSTTARTLANRFADVINVKDFGANGDGVTDDTAAIQAASSVSGNREIMLDGGTYLVSSIPEGAVFNDGYILCNGKLLNVNGTFDVLKNTGMMQRKICTAVGSSAWNPSVGSSNFRWAQGCAYLNVNGVDKLFVTVEMPIGRTYGNAYGMFKIAEFNLREDGGAATLVSETVPLPIGHGQGFGAKYDKSTGKTTFYFDESGCPERYLASSTNAFIGVSVVDYKGASTSPSDVKSYRLRDVYKLTNGAFDDVYSGTMIPTVTPDGKNLVVMRHLDGQVCFYDLSDIENCTVLDTTYTWQDAGETIPYTIDESGYTTPSAYYDASTVTPVKKFSIDANSSYQRQGIACDSKYIYISSGAGVKNTPHIVEVYDYAGHKVGEINHSNCISPYTTQELYGESGSMLYVWENEGLFIKGNRIYTLTMLATLYVGNADIVTYNGQNYLCVTGSQAGNLPSDFSAGKWLPTTLAANKGTWDASVTYSRNSTSYNTISANIWAIEQFDSGNTAQVPVDKNGLVSYGKTYFNDYSINVLAGRRLLFNYINPVSGKPEYTVRFSGNALTLSPFTDEYGTQLYSATSDANSEKFSEYRTYGQDGTKSGSIRQWVSGSSVRPRWQAIRNCDNDDVIKVAPSSLRLRIGSAVDADPLLFFSDNDSDAGRLYRKAGVGTCFASASSINILKLSGTKGGGDGSALDADKYYQSITEGKGVVIDTDGFKPNQNNAYSLGSSNRLWSEVYASTATINTSDERLKSNISDIPDDVLDTWGDVNIRVFQFKEALEKKGESARIHTGVVAQQVKEAFEARGLDAFRYGLLCYDQWDDEYEDVEVIDTPAVYDDEGNEVTPVVAHTEQVLTQEAGDRYSIRYEEALVLEAAYQRRRADRIEARLLALEERLNDGAE